MFDPGCIENRGAEGSKALVGREGGSTLNLESTPAEELYDAKLLYANVAVNAEWVRPLEVNKVVL